MGVACWFDGSTEPVNPGGHTSYGALVKRDGTTLLAKSGYVGIGPLMSNNVGEYAGCIAVMKFLIANSITNGIIFGDSKLVVYQLNGKWRAKKGLYLPYYKEAIILRRQLPEISIKWISRDDNLQADYLSRQAIKTIPKNEAHERELSRLIEAQRRDRHDPRFKVVASRPIEGAPF